MNLYVMCYSIPGIFKIPNVDEDNVEEILSEYGFNDSEVEYMYCDDDLDLVELNNHNYGREI